MCILVPKESFTLGDPSKRLESSCTLQEREDGLFWVEMTV